VRFGDFVRFGNLASLGPAAFVLLCVAAGLPLQSYPKYVIAIAMISMVIGVALVVLVGLARCITLASGAVMAVGAYASTLAMIHLGIPYGLTLLLAIAAGFLTPQAVMDAWLNSPGHRANMLNPEYNAVGIGVVEHKGQLYVAQDFVLLIPVYSEAQFRDAFAEAFNRERKSRGLGVIAARSEESLHEAACSTDGEAQNLSGKITGASALVVFTSSEPDKLPEQLMSRAANPGFHRMAIGVCFRPDPQHGYANFWVVAAFSL
jgi:hypothetical protein